MREENMDVTRESVPDSLFILFFNFSVFSLIMADYMDHHAVVITVPFSSPSPCLSI